MRSLFSFFLLVTLSLALASPTTSAKGTATKGNWPQWRGQAQNGVAVGENFPIHWSEESGVDWKTDLPGNGGSTPVFDGGVAYLTSGVDGKNMLLAYNVADGSLKWKTALGSDRGNKHRKGSGSNPSPVIDGDSIFAYYRSGDLACVGSDGEVRWQTNLQDRFGEDTLWWDLGSSPLLTKTAVVVAVMQTGPSYLVAFDKSSGDELWKTDRALGAPEEAAQSYSTPLAVTVNGKDAIAVMGADHLTLHDASHGRELGTIGWIQSWWREILSFDFFARRGRQPNRLPLCAWWYVDNGATWTSLSMEKGKTRSHGFATTWAATFPRPLPFRDAFMLLVTKRKVRSAVWTSRPATPFGHNNCPSHGASVSVARHSLPAITCT